MKDSKNSRKSAKIGKNWLTMTDRAGKERKPGEGTVLPVEDEQWNFGAFTDNFDAFGRATVDRSRNIRQSCNIPAALRV